MSDTYDVIIIGGGPAGLTAGIYTARDRHKTLLLEKGICGGLPSSTDLIENYPGFSSGVNGTELIAKFKEQAVRFGVNIAESAQVQKVESKQSLFKCHTSKETFTAKTVIVASGSIPKHLNIPKEKELQGQGVSYCATCDGPLYRGKDVAVIGCGNSGLQEGEALLKHVNSITFIEFLPKISAEKILEDRIRKNSNVEFLLNHQLIAINGNDMVSSVTVAQRDSGEIKDINVSGVFIYIGFVPNSKFLEGVVELDKQGYVIVNNKMQTGISGLYAAGDVCSKDVRQITVACGEATVAAISAGQYLRTLL
ncbi:MAG: FAD-dependent oxidoreductase [Candidatus Omnitrophota bacterium]